jgi:hypothetical protein
MMTCTWTHWDASGCGFLLWEENETGAVFFIEKEGREGYNDKIP